MDQAPTVKIESVNGVNKAIVVPSGTRQSVERVVNFIVRSCEEAYPFLKDDFWGTSEYGRVHKGVALALKSKPYYMLPVHCSTRINRTYHTVTKEIR